MTLLSNWDIYVAISSLCCSLLPPCGFFKEVGDLYVKLHAQTCFTPDLRMLGPVAEFASSGQQEEGLTQCSKGAALYQAGRRQAGRGRGLLVSLTRLLVFESVAGTQYL